MSRHPNCTCKVCGMPIYRRPVQIEKGDVFCSLGCFGKSCRKSTRCAVCGTELINRKRIKTCSRACANRLRAGIKYTGVARKDKVKTARLLKKRLIQKRGDKCERCGYPKTYILVIHHKVRRCDGGTNELDNLELICPNCHAEIHYNENVTFGEVAEPG
jgi:5-methylcytosine-specific restriction endonuclease McrA